MTSAKTLLNDKEVMERIVDLLAAAGGKPIPGTEVHAFAEGLEVDPGELESVIYSFASKWAMNEKAKVNPGGKAEQKGVTEADFDEAAVKKGTEVELEHTPDRNFAKKIALDHIAEFPTYYDKLEKMESSMKESMERNLRCLIGLIVNEK